MSLNINLYQKDIQKLRLDSSLNRKIIQNEKRFQNLLSIPKNSNKCYSTDRKAYNQKRFIKSNKKISNKKKLKNFKTEFYNNYDDNDYEIQKNLSQYFSPKSVININDNEFNNNSKNKEDKKIIKVHQKLIKKEKRPKYSKNSKNLSSLKNSKNKSHYNSTINLHTSRNNYKNMNKKNLKKNQKLNTNINLRTNNKNNSNRKNYNSNTIESSAKSDRYSSPSIKNMNLEEMFGRFKKNEKKKKEWVENEKKKKEEEEKKLCSYKPKMDKNSIKINLKIKDNFLERQKMKDEQKKKKEEKLKEYLNKKKEDEINKNNFLLIKNNKGKNKDNNLNNSINLSTSKTSAKTLEKNRKIEIKNAINKLYEWDIKRKEKINQKRKNNNEKIEKNRHIPKINKRSSSMAELKKEKYSDKNIFDRLSKKDPVSLEKKKFLVELYTPSFQPNIYTKRSTKKEKDINEDKNEIEEKKEKEEGKMYEKFGIDNNSGQYINDEDIQQLYRDVLFRNKKKNKMHEN